MLGQRLTIVELPQAPEMELWIRVLLRFETAWLEVFNALDENGYAVYQDRPDGDFRMCARL